jgi:hypothetical protein
LGIAVALGACFGPGGSLWYAPVGWIGGSEEFLGCEGEIRVLEGSSAEVGAGALRAVRPGTAVFVCSDGERRRLRVVQATGLRIEGPTRVTAGERPHYRVQAIGGGQDDLRLDGATALDWSTSDGSEIQPGYCGEMPLFGCPDQDSARLSADRAGRLTLRVRFYGLEGSLEVEVVAEPGR